MRAWTESRQSHVEVQQNAMQVRNLLNFDDKLEARSCPEVGVCRDRSPQESGLVSFLAAKAASSRRQLDWADVAV